MSDKDFIVVLSTWPDAASAAGLAREILEAGHAACVNIIPAVRSMYLWQGRIESSDEVLLLVKGLSREFEALRQAIVARHPYDVPEVVALSIADGHHPYLQWLANPGGRQSDNES